MIKICGLLYYENFIYCCSKIINRPEYKSTCQEIIKSELLRKFRSDTNIKEYPIIIFKETIVFCDEIIRDSLTKSLSKTINWKKEGF